MKKLFLFLLATFSITLSAMAQTTVSGQVVYEADGEPMIGASVVPVGGGNGVATDFDGNFTITLPEGVNSITVSYVGMKAKTVKATDNMIVRLEDNTTQLGEVVVTAFGMKR